MSVNAQQLLERDKHGRHAVPFHIRKTVTASGDTVIDLPTEAGRAVELLDWHLIQGNTTAGNVKLKKGTTDITAVVARGTTANAIVRGGSLDASKREFTVSDALKVNMSAAGSIEINLLFAWKG